MTSSEKKTGYISLTGQKVSYKIKELQKKAIQLH